MSSSAPRGAERMIHQDYIARIRYTNILPPPPNPPKLLDIPNTGLASGQYTTPGFASRLARDQPLNIEADAELGMPLDLVGMPGIFDGDESSIQAPLQLPVPHPHDRALLRPLSTLGKPKFSDSGVSFLRRTEYISSYTSKSRFDSTTSRSLISNVGTGKKRVSLNIDKESPEYIKSEVEQSFQKAAQNLKDRNMVRHPTKRNLQLVDAYPLIPDLDGFTDVGGFMSIKFLTNPVPPSSTYDIRVENSLLRPQPPNQADEEAKAAVKAAYERDPERNPPPDENLEFDFYMTESPADSLLLKRKFDVLDPDHNDDKLYTSKNGSDKPSFKYKRVRAYETASFVSSGANRKYDEVVIALHDGKDGLHQKAAYYYPIMQQMNIRPQRKKNIDKKMGVFSQGEEAVVDYVNLVIEDPDESLTSTRNVFREFPYGAEEEGEQPRRDESNTPETKNGDGQSDG